MLAVDELFAREDVVAAKVARAEVVGFVCSETRSVGETAAFFALASVGLVRRADEAAMGEGDTTGLIAGEVRVADFVPLDVLAFLSDVACDGVFTARELADEVEPLDRVGFEGVFEVDDALPLEGGWLFSSEGTALPEEEPRALTFGRLRVFASTGFCLEDESS